MALLHNREVGWKASTSVLFAMACACAPSIQGRHESNLYFERCHAAELDPQIGTPSRRQCWATWMEHYAANQCVEKRKYAQSRLIANRQASLMASTAPAQSAAQSTPAKQAEPHVFVGPPLAGAGALLASAVPNNGTVVPSQQSSSPCAALCEHPLAPCLSECEHRGKGCRLACDHEYRICLRGCF